MSIIVNSRFKLNFECYTNQQIKYGLQNLGHSTLKYNMVQLQFTGTSSIWKTFLEMVEEEFLVIIYINISLLKV